MLAVTITTIIIVVLFSLSLYCFIDFKLVSELHLILRDQAWVKRVICEKPFFTKHTNTESLFSFFNGIKYVFSCITTSIYWWKLSNVGCKNENILAGLWFLGCNSLGTWIPTTTCWSYYCSNQKPSWGKKVQSKTMSLLCSFRSNIPQNNCTWYSQANMELSSRRIPWKWENNSDAGIEFEKGVWDAEDERNRNNQRFFK